MVRILLIYDTKMYHKSRFVQTQLPTRNPTSPSANDIRHTHELTPISVTNPCHGVFDQVMGRRRRRVVHVVKKTLPKVFTCPNCGMVSVRLEPKEETTIISCGSCGLSKEISNRGKEPIDIYNEFVDSFNKGQAGAPPPETLPEQTTTTTSTVQSGA
jgi:transcription elongation factor Elf1